KSFGTRPNRLSLQYGFFPRVDHEDPNDRQGRESSYVTPFAARFACFQSRSLRPADGVRSRMRRLISESSDSNVPVLLPARVSAPISVFNWMTVAKSALHSRQNLSGIPGSSNKSLTRPHSPQFFATCRSMYVSFNIAAPFLALPRKQRSSSRFHLRSDSTDPSLVETPYRLLRSFFNVQLPLLFLIQSVELCFHQAHD